MKRLAFLILAIGLATSAPASAHDAIASSQTIAMTWPWSKGLDDQITQLNRMRGHVRWLFRNYKSSPQLRKDYFSISRDIDDINARFKDRNHDKRKLRQDVDRAHRELHRIEIALKVKPRDFYSWR